MLGVKYLKLGVGIVDPASQTWYPTGRFVRTTLYLLVVRQHHPHRRSRAAAHLAHRRKYREQRYPIYRVGRAGSWNAMVETLLLRARTKGMTAR